MMGNNFEAVKFFAWFFITFGKCEKLTNDLWGASVWLFQVGNLISDHRITTQAVSQKSIKLHRNCESMADHAWSSCKIFFENEFWTTQRSGNNLCRHASDSADGRDAEGAPTERVTHSCNRTHGHANFRLKHLCFSSDDNQC